MKIKGSTNYVFIYYNLTFNRYFGGRFDFRKLSSIGRQLPGIFKFYRTSRLILKISKSS